MSKFIVRGYVWDKDSREYVPYTYEYDTLLEAYKCYEEVNLGKDYTEVKILDPDDPFGSEPIAVRRAMTYGEEREDSRLKEMLLDNGN